jgi:hypothetical protein
VELTVFDASFGFFQEIQVQEAADVRQSLSCLSLAMLKAFSDNSAKIRVGRL